MGERGIYKDKKRWCGERVHFLRELRAVAVTGKPPRVCGRPRPTRGHPGVGLRLPRTGLHQGGTTHWLTKTWEQDRLDIGAGARGGGAIPAGIFPGKPGPFPIQHFGNSFCCQTTSSRHPGKWGPFFLPQPYCAPACADTHTHIRGAPLGCAQLQEPWGGGGAEREAKPLLEVHLCVQVPKTSGQFFWQANPISVCSARI